MKEKNNNHFTVAFANPLTLVLLIISSSYNIIHFMVLNSDHYLDLKFLVETMYSKCIRNRGYCQYLHS